MNVKNKTMLILRSHLKRTTSTNIPPLFTILFLLFVFFILIFIILRRERSGNMSFQIRQAITSNVTGDSSADFENTINDAIARGEEHLLPGLGVFLEAWWKDASENERNAFTAKLEKHFVS